MMNFDRAGRLQIIGDLESQLELTLGMLIILLRHTPVSGVSTVRARYRINLIAQCQQRSSMSA
jgi:hypothetical protein